MLVDPNLNSPANIDAAVHMKNDYEGWKKKALSPEPQSRSTDVPETPKNGKRQLFYILWGVKVWGGG